MKNLTSRVVLALSCAFVVFAGCCFLPYAGIQMDEALFAGPYYQPVAREFRIRLFHHDIPLMVMTYIGTLKTLLYWPLMSIFRTSFSANPHLAPWVFRLPTVLAGSLTVFIFFYFVRRTDGLRAATIAAVLLACDPTFLLTNTFDWGPVALEHLFVVTACFFLVRFAQNRASWDLPLGFFFLGLALWNKAVFVWALAGLICGVLFVFGKELSKMITRRRLAVAAAGFLLGSLPFMIYNGHRRAETFRSSAHLEPRAAPAKFIHFRSALGGYGLYGYIVSEEWADNPKQPTSLRGRAAAYLRDHWGEHRNGGMPYAALLALIAVPLWWRSRTARFCLVFCAVAWFMMASTRDAGASVHHTVLLWPFPQLFVAIAIAALPGGWGRWASIALCLVLVAGNLMVLVQYMSQFERDGAGGPFDDAIYALSGSLQDVPNQKIYVLDWGIQFPLDVLHNGRLHIDSGHDPFMTDTQTDWQRSVARRMLADPNALFIAHTDKRENFEGVHKRFDAFAEAEGCHEVSPRTVADSNGRPIFEVFKLACEAK